MDPSHTPLIFVLAVLLVFSALASASETALFGITHGQRALLKRTNPRLWGMIESLLASPRELLMQVLLMNMVVNLAYFIVTSILTLSADTAWERVLISVVSLGTLILIGEVFAKLYASSATILFLRLAGPMHILIRKPMMPILGFLDAWVIAPLARLLAPAPDADRLQTVTPEQMSTLIHLSTNDGVIDQGEQELLTSIVAMGQMRVEQVMTPRVDLVWIGFEATHDEIIDLCRSSGLTRLLVCRAGIDSGVSGIINARRVLAGESIEEAINEVLFIPEQGRLDALIEQFRKTKQSTAVCVDEHGGVSGIVTLADVTKELIAGVADPAQSPANEVELIGVGKWSVPGRLSIREWASLFDDRSVIEHAERVNTLGGLIMVLLDRVPEPGDQTRIGEIRLTVEKMEGRSIERVIVEIIARDSDAQGGGS